MSSSNDLYNQEAENYYLAGVLRYPDEYVTIIGNTRLGSSDFVGTETKRIAGAIDRVVGERKGPTLPHIVEALKFNGGNDSLDYLSKLSSLPCSVEQAAGYARSIRTLSVRRQLANAGAKIITIAREDRELEDALDGAERTLRSIVDLVPSAERTPDPADIISRIKLAGVTDATPILFAPTLQAYTGGMRATEFWVIGAAQSTGKSQFAANLVLDIIKNKDKRVALFNIEMSQEVYMMRMLAIKSGVPFKSIRDQITIGFEMEKAMADAERYLSNSGLRLYDTTGTLASIKQEARKIKHREGLDIIVIDYIQSIRGSKGEEVADAREIAIELQALAKELRICVVGLSQVSNQFQKDDIAEGGKGDYYNLKGHGAIKDNADVVILLRRNRRAKSPLLDVQIAKNRNGDLAEFTCMLSLPTGRLIEREQEDYDDEEDE